MLKKIVLKVLGSACLIPVLAIAALPVFAAEVSVPGNVSDYYFNAHFTSGSGGTWSGGGLAAETVSGTWAPRSGSAYDAEKDALLISGTSTNTLTQPLTAAGEYIVEMDGMLDTAALAAEAADNKFEIKLSASGGSFHRPFQIVAGGVVNMNGAAGSTTLQTNTWYTFRMVVALPSGAVTASVIDKATGNPLCESTVQTNVKDISVPVTLSFTKKVTPVYIQNMKLFKNNVGTASPLNPCPPADESAYYFNSSRFENNSQWSGGVPDDTVSGAWRINNAVYDSQHDAMKIDGVTGGYYYAQANADFTSGIYGAEQEFLFESMGKAAGSAIDLITLQGTGNPAIPVLVQVVGTTGELKMFGQSTGKSLQKDCWYTFKQLIDVAGGTVEVSIIEKDTGSVLAYQKGTHSLTAVKNMLRVYSAGDKGFTFYGRNFKLYRNNETPEIPAATFQKETGKVIVKPTITNTTGETLDCTFLIAVYQDEKPVSMTKHDYSICGSADIIWSPDALPAVDIPNDGSQYTVRCFAWDGFQLMRPIAASAEFNSAE